MSRLVLSFVIIAFCALWQAAESQTVKRNRDEGSLRIGASNVIGNGNISAIAMGSASYTLDGFGASPIIGGMVGITDIMELSGQFVPVTAHGLGPVETHLQLTTPGNDKLRFFGFAVIANLYLSTFQDTLSATASSGKPEYNSYPTVSLIADQDWLAFKKWLPLKTYFKFSMDDNPDLLFKYDQLSIAAAIEWKMIAHSLFAEAGFGMYKEKPTQTFAGDAGYAQQYAWVEPGFRYRLFSRFSVMAATKITMLQNVKAKSPLKPELLNMTLRLEAPILFSETNTEAIRTLIFTEQKKEMKRQNISQNATTNKNILGDVSGTDTQSDSLGSFDFARERHELMQHREETQKKMTEIEKLFTDMDEEDSLKMIDKAGFRPQPKLPDSTGGQRK